MKLLLLCLAVMMCAAGCAAPTAQAPQSSVETTTAVVTATTAAVLPENAEETADAAAVEAALGLLIDLPAQAENVSYYIDGEVAYTGFAFEGTQYYWIMGKTLPEMELDENKLPHREEKDWMDYPYTVCWNDAGEGHVLWEDTLQKVNCHLLAMEGADGEKLAELAVMLLPAA